MNYLLDTCVVSEVVKKKPDSTVIQWLKAQNEECCFLSVLTLGELQKGISRLPDGQKKRTLQTWVDTDLRQRFSDRILSVDTDVAEHWGELSAQAEKVGRVVPAIDGLIAATAVAHGLTVVTRNTKDIEPIAVSLLNPWKT